MLNRAVNCMLKLRMPNALVQLRAIYSYETQPKDFVATVTCNVR